MNGKNTTSISKVVPCSLRSKVKETKQIWSDLDQFFQEIAKELDDDILQEIIRRHPVANEFVELL